MPITARAVPYREIAPLHERYRQEMNCQIVHDSIHFRPGWMVEHALHTEDSRLIGYASLAVGGPWKTDPTFMELYVLPEHRSRAFAGFEAFLQAAQPTRFEVQTNCVLSNVMALTFGREIGTEKIVFRDDIRTALPPNGARLARTTSLEDIRRGMAERQDGGEWTLEVDGATVASGGVLFHYNAPYGDVYMDVAEPFRRRGFGSYLVQELKRACYELGAIPAARCSPDNVASRRSLQRAGFVPYAHMLIGSLTDHSMRASAS
jgi:GNAT superfamily N-acetyltransferase